MDAASPERFRQADVVLDAALDLPANERGAFVERTCAADAELQTAVQRLLRAHERSAAFLDEPAARIAAPLFTTPPFPPEDSGAPDPERVGPYRIVRELARGGMGRIYLAERDDAQFRQRVALKLVRGGIDSAYLTRRFLEERQILASLEHPHIARLLDGGITADGVPYFVMEYVEGEPLDRFCDTRRLGVEQRLALFLDVCDAVQYAHRKLVVHRDLKPSNVLVTADGEPKLLDFGIAKLLAPEGEPAGLTATGARMMTPAYASPEQIRGDAVTTASDVYALGVLLYELLTGRHPFCGPEATAFAVEQRILEVEPKRPSSAVTRAFRPADADDSASASPTTIAEQRATTPERLCHGLRGDLDTIILKALRKEPERRYTTAEQMAADIRRHLNGLPVGARRDTWGYRTGKLVKRNRLAVAASAAFVLLLVTAIITTAVQALRIRAQAERIERENQTTEQVAALLTQLFTVADPDQARGETVTARELLDRGAERVERELAEEPEVEARMLDAIGIAYRGLGAYDPAKSMLERSLAIRRRLHPNDDADLAATIADLASVLRFRGDFEPAEALSREALAMRRRLFGDQHPAVVESLNGLGFVLRGRGADAEAEAVYREALARGRNLYNGPHVEVAVALNGLGSTLSDQGRFDEALREYRQALEMYLALVGENHPETGVVLLNLGRTLSRKGEAAEAEKFLRRATEVSRRVQGERHPVYALNLTLLADLLRKQGKLEEAEALYRQALEIQQEMLSPRHANTASTLLGLGRLLMDRGQNAQAEPLLREALAIREQVLVADHWGTAIARAALGACLSRLGKDQEAEPLLQQGFVRLRDALGLSDSRTQSALRQLVDHYDRTGRAGEAAFYRAQLQVP